MKVRLGEYKVSFKEALAKFDKVLNPFDMKTEYKKAIEKSFYSAPSGTNPFVWACIELVVQLYRDDILH